VALLPGSLRPTQAGTFFYHSHVNPDRQQALGLYGALIIDRIKNVVNTIRKLMCIAGSNLLGAKLLYTFELLCIRLSYEGVICLAYSHSTKTTGRLW